MMTTRVCRRRTGGQKALLDYTQRAMNNSLCIRTKGEAGRLYSWDSGGRGLRGEHHLGPAESVSFLLPGHTG